MKRISLSLILILTLLSCSKDFLEVKPKGQVIASTISDYNNLLEYSRLTQISSGNIFINTWTILGDDVVGLEPHYSTAARFGAPDSRNHRLFEWADDVYRADEDTEEIIAFYNRIYVANKIIHEVMEAEGGTEQQKLQYRAEALVHRAFAYFSLVNLFAKPYQAVTASSELGVPLVLKGDFTQSDFSRSSVQQVYDQIVADLSEAISALPLQSNTSNRYCRAAAETLLGKVYLFMGNSEQAASTLSQAFQDLPDHFTVSGTLGLIDYNTATVSSALLGYIFLTPQVGTTASQGHGYPETIKGELAAGANWIGYVASLVISPETYALFRVDDRRRLLYSNAYSPLAPGATPLLPVGLYRSRASLLGANIGSSLPDLYLLLAESRARINDIAGAQEPLVALRRKRMPESSAIQVPENQQDLIRFIIDERRREFATLGFRWYDMRRLSVDPLFSAAVYTHTVYDATGNVKEHFVLRPERFVLRFSDKLISQSSGLVNNP